MAQAALAYTREGEGPDLLLFHGGVGSRNHWTRNIAELSRHFTVTAVDLPGYGASANVPRDMSPNDYLDLVANTAKSLCGGSFRLAGFSFGAVVSAATATRLGAGVSRLTLIAPGGFGIPAGRQLDLRSVPRDGLNSESGLAVLRHNLSVMMLANPARIDDATVQLHKNNVENARFDSRRISFEERLIDDLRKITCPLQLIWGARDPLAYPSIDHRVRLVREAVPDVRVDIIPDGGHWVQYECPAETNRALIDFMQHNVNTKTASAASV